MKSLIFLFFKEYAILIRVGAVACIQISKWHCFHTKILPIWSMHYLSSKAITPFTPKYIALYVYTVVLVFNWLFSTYTEKFAQIIIFPALSCNIQHRSCDIRNILVITFFWYFFKRHLPYSYKYRNYTKI